MRLFDWLIDWMNWLHGWLTQLRSIALAKFYSISYLFLPLCLDRTLNSLVRGLHGGGSDRPVTIYSEQWPGSIFLTECQCSKERRTFRRPPTTRTGVEETTTAAATPDSAAAPSRAAKPQPRSGVPLASPTGSAMAAPRPLNKTGLKPSSGEYGGTIEKCFGSELRDESVIFCPFWRELLDLLIEWLIYWLTVRFEWFLALFYSSLNKLTPENFERIATELNVIALKSEAILSTAIDLVRMPYFFVSSQRKRSFEVISHFGVQKSIIGHDWFLLFSFPPFSLCFCLMHAQIFRKALEEPQYNSLYAQLCRRLSDNAPNKDVSRDFCFRACCTFITRHQIVRLVSMADWKFEKTH